MVAAKDELKCHDYRAPIQLGMRAAALEAYGKREVVEIIDMSAFIDEQRHRVHD